MKRVFNGLLVLAIIAALATHDFHVFPDTMARQIGGAYRDFARDIVEADLMAG